MLTKLASKLEDAVRTGELHTGIQLLRRWLEKCEPGEPNQLLAACSPRFRANVRELMCDVFSYYPNTLLGLPLLILGGPKCAGDGFITLPFPTAENASPCPGLHFLGWLPSDALLPVRMPFRQEHYRAEIEPNVITAFVGVFRVLLDESDIDPGGVHPLWWGDLFVNQSQQRREIENVRLESGILLRYPEAVDIAAAMQAGARRRGLPGNGSFREDLQRAYQQGVAFLENSYADAPTIEKPGIDDACL